MVVAELGERLSGVMKQMSNETVVVDEKVLKECLDEITRALLRSDVQFKLVRDMEYNVKNIVNRHKVENKRDILQQAIFSELLKMLDSGNPSFIPEIGKPSVIMFVGLQGSGKTATCTKYAHFHSKKGWKPALVCTDTASFDQLKQNAAKAKIPFYGSCTESDPLKIAVEGVERFKKGNCDLIVVETGGRYKQEAQLFEEMRQASEATKPDLVIFVMDSSIGRAAFDQAQAFRQSVPVGAVILTKMDGHAKGAGALTAVAAAKTPVIFIGTGENNMYDEFEVFHAEPFVGRLLGMGNWSGLMEKIHEDVRVEDPRNLRQRLHRQELFTPRLTYQHHKDFVGKFRFGQLPSTNHVVRGMHVMDWMTNEELDNLEIMDESRIRRIAQDSGYQVDEVTAVMESINSRAAQWQINKKRYARTCSRNKSAQNTSKVLAPQVLKQRGAEQWQMNKKRKARTCSRNMSAQNTSKVLAPQVLKQRGGIGDLQNSIQQMALDEDMMGKYCRGLPTQLATPQVVKDILRSNELKNKAPWVVVDIIPPENSFLPASPTKKPSKLKSLLSWRKHWDSVDKLSKKLSAIDIVEDQSEEGMVVSELGERLSGAIKQMSNETVVVDEKVLKECLDEITCALLRSDVQFKLARDMEYNVKNIVNRRKVENKRDILQQAIFSELLKMLDSGTPSFIPEIGKPSVIMFVGLQGSGKTATCAKYAHFYSNKGWKPALVCTDTASFDQLKQNAAKAKIPFYGSCTESDPVKIAVEGVERFKKENCDLIVVDAGGRYEQEAQLFEGMRQASEATKPDLVIFVMDSSIGRAAFDQAQAFRQSVPVGAVILTKMDGHANGAGALTAVAAAKTPVIFIGTGENMYDEFEIFRAKPFVGRLLGMGNWSGLLEKNHGDVRVEEPRNLRRRLHRQELFTPRLFYEQYKYYVGKLRFGQLPSTHPAVMGIHVMDWMTNEELDNLEIMDESRIRRIAQDSGYQVDDVTTVMEETNRGAEQWQINKKRYARTCSRIMSAQNTSKVLAPQVLKHRGGIGDLQNSMQQMALAEDLTEKYCRWLPTERATPQVVKDILRSDELKNKVPCVVVDIIRLDDSFLPASPTKKPNKLNSLLSWRKHWESFDKLSKKLSAVDIVEDLSEEGFAVPAKRFKSDKT